MLNQDFFETALSEQISAKANEGVDQPSVRILLNSGQEFTVFKISATSAAWVVLEVYPPKGKTLRKHHSEDRKAGAPQYDFDRVCIPYANIGSVVVTLEPKSKSLGFHV